MNDEHPEPLIDTTNRQLVGMRGSVIVVLAPKQAMSADEAMQHAAWLVTLAEMDAEHTFEEHLNAVQQ